MKILIIAEDCFNYSKSVEFREAISKFAKERNMGDIPTKASWNCYTFIDEKKRLIATYVSIQKLISEVQFLGNCIIVTEAQFIARVKEQYPAKKPCHECGYPMHLCICSADVKETDCSECNAYEQPKDLEEEIRKLRNLPSIQSLSQEEINEMVLDEHERVNYLP